jgi:autotransporter-associated beta strand protein
MNPPSPREELEIRITAMLMGELPPDEAAALETQIAADAELTALHARLRRALGLLREATAIPEQPAPPVPARLSDERRVRLLAHFQGAKPGPVIVKPRRDWKRDVPLGLAASLIALIGGAMYVNGFALRKASVAGASGMGNPRDEDWASQRGMIRSSGEKRRESLVLYSPVDALRDRTKATLGFQSNRGAITRTATASGAPGVSAADTARAHFSREAHSRSPELNLFGRPRVATAWPSESERTETVAGLARATAAETLYDLTPRLMVTPPPARTAGGTGAVYLPRAAAEVSASDFAAGIGNLPDGAFAGRTDGGNVLPKSLAISEPFSTDGKVNLPALASSSGPQSPQGGAVLADSGKPVSGGEPGYVAGSFWDTPRVQTYFDRGVSGYPDSYGKSPVIRGGLASSEPIANQSTDLPSRTDTIADNPAKPALTSETLYDLTPRLGSGIALPALSAGGAGRPALAEGGEKAGTLEFNGASSVVSRPSISSTGSLAKSGDGKLALAGNNAYAGGTTVTGGTLQGLAADWSRAKAKPEAPPANPTPQGKPAAENKPLAWPEDARKNPAAGHGEVPDERLRIDSPGGGRNDTNGRSRTYEFDFQAGTTFGFNRLALGDQPFVPGILGTKENIGPIRIDYGTPVKDTAGPPPNGGKFQYNVGYKIGGETDEDDRKPMLDPQVAQSDRPITFVRPMAGQPGSAPAVAQPAVSGESGNPVRWLEVTRNGTLVNPAANATDGARRSDDNPVVGRIAFWTDDETVKVNVNTAAGFVDSAGAAQAPKSALPGTGAEKSAAVPDSSAAGNIPADWAKQPHFFTDLNAPAGPPQDSTGVATSSGVIAGTGGVTLNKAGAGAWKFEDAHTFNGGTTVNAGTLSANPSNQPHPDGVHISGNTRTRDKVIRRDLATVPGDLFDTVKRDKALNGGALTFKKTGAASPATAAATANALTFGGTGSANETSAGVTTRSGQRAAGDGDRDSNSPAGSPAPIPKTVGGVITGDIGFDVVSNYVTKGLVFSNDPHNTAGTGAARATATGETDRESMRADRRVKDGKDDAAKKGPASLNEMSVLEPFPAAKDVADSPISSGKTPSFRGGLASSQPVQNEFQRYPGHPATTSLGLVLNNSLNLSSTAGKRDGIDVEARRAGVKQDLQEGETDEHRAKSNVPVLGDVAVTGKLFANGTEAAKRVEQKLGEASAAEAEKEEAKKKAGKPREEPPAPKPAPNPLVPQPEIRTDANAFSTFSLNVSDVAFKLAGASLEHGTMPDVSTLRSEEFINAFDYRDPEPAAGMPLGFVSERARYPFAQNRDLLRLSVKTAAAGRQPGRPLNLVLLIDNSGSMERADRVRIVREAMRVLSAQLTPQDKLSIVTFARTPTLREDGIAGDKAAEATARVGEITPEGGTNLAAALDLGYATALKPGNYQPGSINRVVVLTDGAANLGDVDPAALKQKVEAHRKQGVALDCFGIGWEGLNDDMLEQLSRNGDGRYGFINTPEEAAANFAGQLAGALRVAASDVKVQVEWNPKRVTAYRQIGYAKHQLTKEQFRDNTVDAAEIGAAESGNALYVVEVNPRGEGDLATVRVRFKVPGTSDYREHEWTVPFTGNAAPLEQSSSTLRLAATASAFSEMLASSPYATEVTSDRLLGLLNGVPAIYGADPRPKKLEWMIRQAKSLSGR